LAHRNQPDGWSLRNFGLFFRDEATKQLADYVYQVIRGSVRSYKLLSDHGI
jgi:hypothetical protein